MIIGWYGIACLFPGRQADKVTLSWDGDDDDVKWG